MKVLITHLNMARDAYYNQNNPIMSDYEYDNLFDKLEILEKETGVFLNNSPTQQVGYEVKSALQKVKHTIPLLSLAKTKSVDDLVKFIDKQECLLMLKYDGLTCELIYNEGKLVQASTRGDGISGEDITHNAKTFVGLPLEIPYKNYLKVVGEAIILSPDFTTINAKLSDDKKYKNARNLVSGSVRQLNSKICSKRKVRFALWDVLEGLDDVVKHNNRFDKIKLVSTYGFDEPEFYSIARDRDLEMLPTMIINMKNYASTTGIPIDGLVIKYNDIDYSKSLGSTSHHNNDGIAYKFYDEEATTTLTNVEWTMGKTGILTPTAVFKSCEIDGTDVSRASLHNVSIFKDFRLGIGDEIIVIKANQIIPQIKKNLTKSNTLQIPDACPICGYSTEIKKENQSEVLFCSNPNCKGKLLGRFVNFCSKPAMNIEGLSESTLKKFIQKGYLKTFVDIYHLDNYRNDIIRTEGFGEKSWNNIWDAIQKSRDVKFENFLVALGIPNVGKTASKTISKYCKGDWNIFESYLYHNQNWSNLKDFGNVIDCSIKEFYESDLYKITLELVDVMNFNTMDLSPTDINSPFINKTVVVTGSLEKFSRTEIQNKLEELGAKVSSSVSKKTDYVIYGGKAGSKLIKAQNLGVKTISEEELLQCLNQ